MQVLFYISLAVTVVGFILSVVIFFLYDIPMIYAIRSGKQEEKTIAKLNRRSAKVGNFGGKRPAKAPVHVPPQPVPQDRKPSTGLTGGTSTEIRKKIRKLRVEQNSEEISRPPIIQETEMLGVDSLSRMAVQDAAPKADTVPLRVEAPVPQMPEAGVTTELTPTEDIADPVPQPQVQPDLPPDFFFQITEDTVVCDTEERI